MEQLAGIERFCVEREGEICDAIGQDLRRTPFDSWFGEIVGTKAEAGYARNI